MTDERGEGGERGAPREQKAASAEPRSAEQRQEQDDAERGMKAADRKNVHETGIAKRGVGVIVQEAAVAQQHGAENPASLPRRAERTIQSTSRENASRIERPARRPSPPEDEPDEP
jgi:hypothetical protein